PATPWAGLSVSAVSPPAGSGYAAVSAAGRQPGTRGQDARQALRGQAGPGGGGRPAGADLRPVRQPVVAAAEFLVFLAGAAVSLSASYLLVTRLERIGEWLGLSEGLLGVLAALAGAGPELTAAVAALAMHQNQVGAGVVIGSNVFNLAALLGLGAVVAGAIALHRKVIILGGAVGVWVAVACLVTVLGVIPPAAGLAVVLAALIPYVIVLGASRARLGRVPLPPRWRGGAGAAGCGGGGGSRGGGPGVGGGGRTRRGPPPAARPGQGRGRRGGRPAGGRGGQRGHGARRDLARHALRDPGHHRRRGRPRRGHQPAELGRRGLPRRPGPRRRHAEYHAEQQRAERYRRAAAARRDHRARAAVGPVGPHRRVVPGADAHRAGVRLPRQRDEPRERGAHHRRLSRVRGFAPDRGSLGGTRLGRDYRSSCDCCGMQRRGPCP